MLTGHALKKSPLSITAIESAIARASWFASADSRPVNFSDVEKSMIEAGSLSPLPSREPTATAPPFPREDRFRL